MASRAPIWSSMLIPQVTPYRSVTLKIGSPWSRFGARLAGLRAVDDLLKVPPNRAILGALHAEHEYLP